ncbi:MAG: hypothetical protein BEN18_04460 [Epulopiscium sp. Nuni2H_MBin001]|nr:MAG: hypothetical protein BEN18_04460 [Epulopiscium sp. Nuni2H_MBin001]
MILRFFNKYKIYFIFIAVVYSLYSFIVYLSNYSNIYFLNIPKRLENKPSTVTTLSNNTQNKYQIDILDNTTIGVPSSDDNPVVFILHNGMDLTYLVEELASNGYLTLSIDTTNTDITDHLRLLKQYVETEDIYLTNKADFSQVSIMGIGASGLQAYEQALYPMDNSLANLVSVLLVAPDLTQLQDNTVPSVPVGIVLSQYDGNVRTLDGQNIFDTLAFSNNLQANASCLYLFNANHNFYDASNLEDDALNVPNAESPRLEASAQQDFLRQYSADFFNNYHHNITSTNIGLDSSQIAPNTIYDYNVLTSLITPNSLAILSPTESNSQYFTSLGGSIDMHNASITYVTESYMAPYDNAAGFQHPGLPMELGLLKFSWTVDSGLFSTSVPPIYEDFSKYNSLSLWLSLDPINKLNSGNTPQSLMITLKDNNGYVEHLILDESSIALHLPDGYLVSNNYQSQWSTFTPLSNLRIPLDTFTKVDLTQIDEITFKFNQTPSGSILVGDFRLLY